VSMENLNRFRPRPSQPITYEGHAFLITDLEGFIGSGIEGFYYRQTRFFLKMRLTVDGAEPRFVAANSVDAYSSMPCRTISPPPLPLPGCGPAFSSAGEGAT
jgi:glycogen debranching enzyme-like protein